MMPGTAFSRCCTMIVPPLRSIVPTREGPTPRSTVLHPRTPPHLGSPFASQCARGAKHNRRRSIFFFRRSPLRCH